MFQKIFLVFLFIFQSSIIQSRLLKKHKRKLFSIPGVPKIPGVPGAPGSGGGADPDEFKSTNDKDLKPKGKSIGIVMRVDRPEDAKPVYINMSPIYDFGNYII